MAEQWLRKASLMLVNGAAALDLSDLRFTFKSSAADTESPNSVSIRVYNLSEATVRTIRGEFSRIVLQAGYAGNFGVIFDGTIKQYRVGKETATTSYLDILAADGDIGYNFGVVNRTLAAGSSPAERTAVTIAAMGPQTISAGYIPNSPGGILPRGKVLFGMARDYLHSQASSTGSTWSIQNGKINVVPLDSYLPGEAVVLTAATGLIGIPEQTAEGVKVRCLMNPRIIPGCLVQIDNKSVNQTFQANPKGAPVPYDKWAGIQLLASITSDGFYRVYVAEHDGDTRGTAWYSDLVCLSVNPSTQKVRAP